jgi:putative ATP-dependent endonuclease of OLD family
LRGWNAAALELTDEPDDHLESVLTVRLMVEKDLEPNWMVICDHHPEGVPFKQADRNQVSVGLIGAYSERQLSWATGTALAKLTETQSLNELLTNASRTARTSLDADRPVTLKNFDAAAVKSQEIAKLLGVPVLDTYKAHLDLASINLKVGGLTLHDGDMPLRQLTARALHANASRCKHRLTSARRSLRGSDLPLKSDATAATRGST